MCELNTLDSSDQPHYFHMYHENKGSRNEAQWGIHSSAQYHSLYFHSVVASQPPCACECMCQSGLQVFGLIFFRSENFRLK